jgi:threonyl-tRNA synthetase
VPFLLVVGDKEASEGKVSVRTRGKGDEGQVATADFVARVTKLIETKAPEIG